MKPLMSLSMIFIIMESSMQRLMSLSCCFFMNASVDSLILHPICIIVEFLLSVFVTMEGSMERLMSLSG